MGHMLHCLSNDFPRKHLIYGVVIVSVLVLSALRLSSLSPYSKSSGVEYVRAEVVRVQAAPATSTGSETQTVQARILDGEDMSKMVSVARGVSFGDQSYKRLPAGSELVLVKDVGNGNRYTYGDRWRMPGVSTLLLLLLVLVVAIGWWRGITSVFGLTISVGVLSAFVLPRIIAGHDAYTTCIQGAFMITVVSIYVAHGVSRRTTVALIGTLATLAAIVGLTALASYVAGTSAVIDEQTASILYGARHISLAGLLTGGIIIASLGTVYDITIGQAAAVDEIYKADTAQDTYRLYRRGLSVGREHIAALVNTLVLVYAGAALPSIVVTALYGNVPFLIALNSEPVVEEIVRTCVASLGVLLAVPLTTGLAAYVLPRWHDPPHKLYKALLGTIRLRTSRLLARYIF